VSNTGEQGRAVVLVILFIVVAGAVIALTCWWYRQPRPGHVKDEALQAGRDASSFIAADEDYFHDMDGGIPLEKAEIQGRNTWIVWTAGDDRLWDQLVENFIFQPGSASSVGPRSSLGIPGLDQ
jgi:hypothetical protein